MLSQVSLMSLAATALVLIGVGLALRALVLLVPDWEPGGETLPSSLGLTQKRAPMVGACELISWSACAHPCGVRTFLDGCAFPASLRFFRGEPGDALTLFAGALTACDAREKSPVACGKSSAGMSAPPFNCWHVRQ